MNNLMYLNVRHSHLKDVIHKINTNFEKYFIFNAKCLLLLTFKNDLFSNMKCSQQFPVSHAPEDVNIILQSS